MAVIVLTSLKHNSNKDEGHQSHSIAVTIFI